MEHNICPKCGNDLELVVADEADFGVEWCTKCGTLIEGELAESGEKVDIDNCVIRQPSN